MSGNQPLTSGSLTFGTAEEHLLTRVPTASPSSPAAESRLGKDPAFGSGPLATVIQDLLSILIYFAIASSVVR
jgi:Mg/Co/Ni transporter MgtE